MAPKGRGMAARHFMCQAAVPARSDWSETPSWDPPTPESIFQLHVHARAILGVESDRNRDHVFQRTVGGAKCISGGERDRRELDPNLAVLGGLLLRHNYSKGLGLSCEPVHHKIRGHP